MVKFVNGQMFYSCVVCKRSYVILFSFRRYVNVYLWRRIYFCYYCNKVFALVEYRIRYEIWYTGERRYQCIFCFEIFMIYYIFKNYQKFFYVIDYRLFISKKIVNGGLKFSVYLYKFYRFLFMKCKRVFYKSYRNFFYENFRENSQISEFVFGFYVIQNLYSFELFSLNF